MTIWLRRKWGFEGLVEAHSNLRAHPAFCRVVIKSFALIHNRSGRSTYTLVGAILVDGDLT